MPQPSGLAARAEPRAAAACTRLLDRVAAAQTRFAGAPVDAELGLHLAALAVRVAIVAEGRALPGDPEAEGTAYAADERAQLIGRELVGRAQRMEPGPRERFVRIDVPHSGEDALVEDRGLEGRFAPGEPVGEGARGQAGTERLL